MDRWTEDGRKEGRERRESGEGKRTRGGKDGEGKRHTTEMTQSITDLSPNSIVP